MKVKEILRGRSKRTDIQALRAIAVLAVVVYHLWPHRLTGGFMGVDIFFVISGYLMTITITRDIRVVTNSKQKVRSTLSFLSTFYARRIKRLIPAAAVTLLATLGLVQFTQNPTLITKTADQVLSSAYFVQNWKLASEATDYLAPSEPPTAVQHFWSLSLEEQFYLVWPLLLVVVTILTSSLLVLYKKNKFPGSIIPMSLLTGGLFVYGYLLTQAQPAEAYFVTPARVWELMLGGILALCPVIKNRDLKLLLPWLGVGMLLYALFKLDGAHFPGWHALIPVIGTLLIIAGGSSDSESPLSFTDRLKAKPIQWIGDISYSLYLWHWPLIVLLPLIFTFDLDGNNGALLKIGILTLSFIIAWLSYMFIEQPPLRLRIRKRWIYGTFVLVLLVVGSLSYVASTIATQRGKDGVKELHNLALNQDNECFGGRAIQNEKTCGNSFGKADKEWSHFTKADYSLNLISDNGRFCKYYRLEEYSPLDSYCDYGDTDSSTNIVVWGDSHADHWANALDAIGRRNNIKFTHFSSGSCAADSVTSTECKDRLDFIKNTGILQKSSAIIVSVVAKDDEKRIENVFSTLKSITDSPTYLLEDVPNAGTNGGPDCLSKGRSCKENEKDVTSIQKDLSSTLVNNGTLKKEQIIPTSSFFCKDDTCYSFIGGVSVYRDTSTADDFINSHISPVYALSISSLLEDELRSYRVIN